MGLFDKIFSSEKARKQKMLSVSTELELDFMEKQDFGMHQQLGEFKLFQVGGSRKVSNVLSAPGLGFENHLFDYKYVISTGNSTKVFNQTVFFINSKELSLPQFYQKPESIFTKLLSILGFDDIDFYNHETYSDLYHLKGEYEEVIRYYFSKEVLDLLTSQKEMYLEGMNYYLILYQRNKLCPPEQIRSFRNFGLMLHKLLLLRSKEINELII